MTKIAINCVCSMPLEIIILMSVIILPHHIAAQTLEGIQEERNRFKMNPQIKLDSGLSSIAVNSLNKIYVADNDSDTIYVIDSDSGDIYNGNLIFRFCYIVINLYIVNCNFV